MNDGMKMFLAFVTGAAVGSLIAVKVVEKKYRQLADEEIESVKEVFNNRLQKEIDKEVEKSKKEAYGDYIKQFGYGVPNEKEEVKNMEDERIYVIPPESFGEVGYKTVSLTYYADKVLAYDSTNEVIKNVDKIVGHNSLETFGEFEDDSVFVRNDDLKIDYEILLDMRKYSDVVSKKPHLVTDDDDDQ